MKKIISLLLIAVMIFAVAPMNENMVSASETTEFPAEINPFGTTVYYKATEKVFFDEILPEIEKNIKENNTHTVSPYYDKFPLANNPENFQGLGHATYANINGKTVTAEAFYRVSNEALNDPNCGLGLLLYQCIQYKRVHPEEDVRITFSSYRTSAGASVCVLPESKYYGYMRTLYTTNYDEQGFVRISYMLVEAARMGIEVTMVNQLQSYGRKQYNPDTGTLKTRSHLNYETYFKNVGSVKCYDSYAKGKKVSDFFTCVKAAWPVNENGNEMQHLKSLTVTNYIATDGTEHGKSVFFASANLDDLFYNGANGQNGSQTGVIVSDHDELWRVTYNYTKLMTKYVHAQGIYELRNIVRSRNMEQLELIKKGEKDKIPEDEIIIYPGSETDSVFELYFTPFGGAIDSWETDYNPTCKYIDKLQASDDYVEFTWNSYSFGDGTNIGNALMAKVEDVFCNNPNPLNKFSIHLGAFDTTEIEKLKLGSEIGFRNISSNSGIHAKDPIMSYSENGVRHNVCMMTSCNYGTAAFWLRTNSMLVINEIDSDVPGFYEILSDKYSYGATGKSFEVNPSTLVLEVDESFDLSAQNTYGLDVAWSSGASDTVSVTNGRVTAKKTGTATITAVSGSKKDTVKVTVVSCKGCYNEKGLTCNHNEQYVLTEKHSSMPLTFEAEFSVDYETLTGTTAILGSDNRYDATIVFSLNKNGQPRLAMRNEGMYSGTSVYTFSEVNVATGENVHLAFTIDFAKKEIRCYVNGELAQTKKTGKITAPFEEKHTAVIGGDLRNGNTTRFTGTIYSVSLWSDVRTAEEIAADYKNGINTSDEKLLAAYDFRKCPEHFTKDLSANSNDLQLIELWQDKEDVEPVGDFDYSFAVIGDTQTMCQNDTEAMTKLYKWIVNNKQTEKIEYVIGLGDITNKSTDAEWQDATDIIGMLNDEIPYTLVRGNHDDWDDYNRNLHNGFYENTLDGLMNEETISLTDPAQPGLAETVLEDGTTVMLTRSGDEPEGGEVQGDLTNSYRTFTIQGTDYLILTLDFAPDEEMLRWADKVITEHPDHKVIAVTHAYMYRDGTTISEGDCYPPTHYEGYDNAQNGDDMWEKCFSKHDNVLLVLSGHDPWQHIVYRQDKGENGNVVTQMLVDPQYVDSSLGSVAMVAMLYFSNNGRTLTVRYYSVERDCYGSVLSQFTIGLYDHEHEYVDNIVPATTAKDGKIQSICKECAEVRSESTIPLVKTILLSETKYTENSQVLKPTVIVKDSNGKVLTEGTDYTVKYQAESITPGTYTVTVEFKGKYSGSKELSYVINKKPEPVVVPGDIDNDGKITAADARFALRASVKLEILSDKQKLAADIDSNGSVTASDARTILRISVGLESKPAK